MVNSYTSLADIHGQLNTAAGLGLPLAYVEKQCQRIPDAPIVDRAALIVETCTDKRVLHLGCGWPPSALHQAIVPVAAHVVGVDIAAPAVTPNNIWQVDLDARPDGVPLRPYDVIIAGEVLEHLVNPGNLLYALRRLFPDTMLLVTVPNALAAAGQQWLERGYENCNKGHFTYFSWYTGTHLLEHCGYTILEWSWYGHPPGGLPGTAEGLVFVCSPYPPEQPEGA